MVRLTYLVALLNVAWVIAAPSPVVPDPAGTKNVGNGVGSQFIGGSCLSSKDCASTCCAFNNNGGGVCSGLGAQFQAGKSGCGFGDGGAGPSSVVGSSLPSTSSAASTATATSSASGSVAAASIDTSAPGSQNVGTGNGQQFITGQCLSDADCASACCAGPKGVCSAVAVAFDSGKQGCGFTTTGATSSAAPAAAAAVDSSAPAAASSATGATVAVVIDTSSPGSQNVGKGNAQQFITGQCLTDADCASSCCASPKGVCSAVAVAFDAGKQGCGFVGTVA